MSAVARRTNAPWVDSAPSHWSRTRLKWTVTSCRNGAWGGEPSGGDDDIACVRVADFDRTKSRVRDVESTLRAIPEAQRRRLGLAAGDLLLEKSGGGEQQPVGRVVLYDLDRDAVCSNFIARMPVAPHFEPRFLCYLHDALYAARVNTRSIKQNTGIQNLDSDAYLNEQVAAPELAEQRAIANYLDRETARIDQLISQKRRQLRLLHEKRAALVHFAFLEFDQVVPLKRVLAAPLAYGVLKPDKYTGDNGVELIRILDVEDGAVNRARLERISPEQSAEYSRTAISAGDLVVSVVGTLGRSFVVPSELRGTNLSRALCRVQLMPTVEPRFAEYWTLSAAFTSRLESVPTGTAQRVLNLDDLRLFPFPAAPLETQMELVTYLDRATADVRAAIAKTREHIELLSEYRAAVISAAVRGRIDVLERSV